MKYKPTPLALVSDRKLIATESSSLNDSNRFTPVEATSGEILEPLSPEVRSQPLSPEEQHERHQLELKVGQAFYQTGKALAQLRQRQLYRSTHKTFEAYCQERFGFSRRYSDYLIAAAVVVENLTQMRTIHSQNQLAEDASAICTQILPTKLEQIKPLASLKPNEQRQVWDKAIATANGKVPSGRIVKGIVQQLTQKTLVLAQDDWQIGDVFTLGRLKGNEKKYNGCWAIALEFTDLTVIVEVHDATVTVKPDNLDKLDSPQVKQHLPQTLNRIRRLREISSLDRGADNVLEDLGHHTDLTPVEEDLLSWLEKYYQVERLENKS